MLPDDLYQIVEQYNPEEYETFVGLMFHLLARRNGKSTCLTEELLRILSRTAMLYEISQFAEVKPYVPTNGRYYKILLEVKECLKYAPRYCAYLSKGECNGESKNFKYGKG